MVTIIDYGLGNLGSISNMFKRIQVECEITSDHAKVMQAKKILLPGVGAFDAAMQRINDSGLLPVLQQKALEEKVPFLGICLGMQLLTEKSEEGELKGLGFIKGETLKFNSPDNRLKIPHMGWNLIHIKNNSLLTAGMEKGEQKFYFVHSYYVKCSSESNIVAQTNYSLMFDSIIQDGNIFGAQFHPEKSHRFGMNLLTNFAKI